MDDMTERSIKVLRVATRGRTPVRAHQSGG
jgi:hypothetical protein